MTAVRWIGFAELTVAAGLVLFITLAISLEVWFRYVLASSLIWVEEAATIAFIWLTLLGAALAAKAKRHIWIRTVEGVLSARQSLALELLGYVAVLAVACLIAIFSASHMPIQRTTTTVSLPINFPRHWVFAWPTCLSMASIALTQVVFIVDALTYLCRPSQARTVLPIMRP